MSLDLLEVEGDFAVLAVQCSFFTFSLVMPLFFTAQDEDLAGFTWYALILALALVLCLIFFDATCPRAAPIETFGRQAGNFSTSCIVWKSLITIENGLGLLVYLLLSTGFTGLGSRAGEQFETVDTEAMSTLSLDRLPQDLVTLLALVLSFHGNSQHILRYPLEGGV